MSKEPAFPNAVVEALNRAKILGVRAGTEHRYTGSARFARNRVGRFRPAISKFPYEAN